MRVTIPNSNIITVEDVSGFTRVPVLSICNVVVTEHIIDTIMKARIEKVPVIACGTHHSMGGHSLCNGGYILDMNSYNQILDLNLGKGLLTVESGIKWCDIIKYLNDFGLSPMTLQSYQHFLLVEVYPLMLMVLQIIILSLNLYIVYLL